MKKIVFIIGVLLVSLIMMGCSSRNSDLDRMGLHGNIKSFEQVAYDADDELFDQDFYFNGYILYTCGEIGFNTDGFIVEEIATEQEEEWYTINLLLDKDNYPLEFERKSDLEGDIEVEFESEDGKAVLTSKNRLIGQGDTSYGDAEVVYAYNDNGYLEETEWTYDGDVQQVITYDLNDENMITDLEVEEMFGDIEVSFEYEDDLAVELEILLGGTDYTFEMKYKEFDEEGNWTKMKMYLNDEFFGTFEREYEYY